MRKVEVRFSESDLQALDNIAKKNNTTRAEIIRARVNNHTRRPADMQTLSRAIRRRAFGITREQADHAAAIAISILANNAA